MDILKDWDHYDGFSYSDLEKTVTAIHLVATYVPPDHELKQFNHWRFFLELKNERSVCLDMTSGYGSDGLRGRIAIRSKNYPCTTNLLSKTTFKTAPGIIDVKKIACLLAGLGRHTFRFTPSLEGCRHWSAVVVGDLEEMKYIETGSLGRAMQSLTYSYGLNAVKTVRVIQEGTFNVPRTEYDVALEEALKEAGFT